MPNIHPLLVHFPIALLTTGFLFDALSVLTKRDDMQKGGWWMLLTGSVGLGLTILSGLLAEKNVSIPGIAREQFDTHQQFAFVAAALYASLLLWRIGTKTRLPDGRRAVYLLLSLAGVMLIWFTAWHGGELVYRFGVGVSPGA